MTSFENLCTPSSPDPIGFLTQRLTSVRSALLTVLFILTLTTLQSVQAQQTGACVDNDGDGWGWNGVESCLIESNNSGLCVDSDGDGWGWNGVESCLVDPSVIGLCVDSDGDGWGWNGVESCLVDPDSELPRIVGLCVDTDGDGWGWNGVESCLIDSNNSGLCVDNDGDGWGWNGTATCSIAAAAPSVELQEEQEQVEQVEQVEEPASPEAVLPEEPAGDQLVCIDSDNDGWGWNGQASCELDLPDVALDSPDAVVDLQTPADSGGNANNPLPTSGSFDRARDLVALHYDHAPDPDDGHAAAAGYIVTQELGLNVSVVGGAYGVWNANRYVPASENLMVSIWGTQWLDAHNNRSSAVAVAASRWAGTLAAGGDIWIAEGGQSDFTAAVVRLIQQQFPEIQTTSRINLVQHSQWNEDHANASDLAFVKSNTRYVRIEDGNDPNSTADFRSEAPDSFVNSARASSYAGIWNSAFDYLSPFEKLDFSDTVELMYILGIGTETIATVEQFADRFMR